jgi:hypothetical protein
MQRFLLLLSLIVLTKITLSQPFTTKDSVLSNYNHSKAVFSGIINNIYEMKSFTLIENQYIVEFQLTEIYKGKRREKIITLNDEEIVKNLKIKEEYLVYTDKDNRNDYYYINRVLSVKDSLTILEIKILYEHLKTKLIRRVKTPLPNFKLVLKGCGC